MTRSTPKSNAPVSDERRAYYSRIAAQHGLKLPPIAFQPRWWPAFLRVPTYQPRELPNLPGAVLRALLVHNWRALAIATVVSVVNYVAVALIPRALGQLLDSGLERGLGTHLLPWSLGLLLMIGIGAIAAAFNQLTSISVWLNSCIGVSRSSSHRAIANSVGVSSKMPSGDVVATISSDVHYIGALMEFIPSTFGALVSTILVAVLMLQVSVKLGLIVIIGLPLVILGVTALIKPLQQRQNAQREAQGKLTSITTDAVVGLRVLRGIGGEGEFDRRYRKQSQRVRDFGVRIAPLQALLNAWREGVPGIFSTVVIAVAAMMVFDGEMTAGDMVAFYGYTTFMMAPVWSLTNAIQFGTRAWVAARKVGTVFGVELAAEEGNGQPAPRWELATLSDHRSGVQITAGNLTALVCADPDQSAALARRLAGTQDLEGVAYDDVRAQSLNTREIRQGIVLASASDHLFSGTLRSNLLGPRAQIPTAYQVDEIIYRDVISRLADTDEALTVAAVEAEDDALTEAMHVADGDDIIAGLPGGLNGQVTERGRSLSGGQRQRVAIARAIATQAPVLIFIEPTSAVDSHTESRIGERLRQHRLGRTTVVVTASPLLLEKCDEVVVLDRDSGKEIARATHDELIDRAYAGDPIAAQYRAIVQRATGSEGEEEE